MRHRDDVRFSFESADDPGLYWIEPEQRGVIPLDGLVVSRRLARTHWTIPTC